LGGVFVTRDAGRHWLQKSSGLGGRDVFALKQAPNGALVAGTNRGIFMLDRTASLWRPINAIVSEKAPARTGKRGAKKSVVIARATLDARVNDIEITPKRWIIATSAGLFTSSDQGKSWSGGAVMGKNDFVAVELKGERIVAATRNSLLYSANGGTTWQEAALSSYLTSIHGVTIAPDGEILVASREGAFRSSDGGVSWEHVTRGLPDKNVSSISYDESAQRLLATSMATGVVFESQDGGRSWHRGPDSGYPLRRVSVMRGRFLAATPFDGVILQPEGESERASAGLGGSSN